MYKILSDGFTVYHPNLADRQILSGKLNMEVNKAGSLTFEIPDSNVHYGYIKLMKSIVELYDDDELIFRGRPYAPSRNLYRNNTIMCEGELAFLNDTTQEPFEFYGTVKELFTKMINTHNSKVSVEKQFKVGIVNVTNNTAEGYITRSSEDPLNTWKFLNDKFLDPLGGYINLRHQSDGTYIDYLAELNFEAEQPIEQCVNLVDAREEVTSAELATAIMPLGAKLKDESGNETGKRLTIESVNSGKTFIESNEGIEEYGRIERVVIHDDITLPSNLKKAGELDLAAALGVLTNIELKAADLSKAGYEVASFKIGTQVPVNVQNLGIDKRMLVRKIAIDLLNPQNSILLVGDSIKSFTAKFQGGLTGQRGPQGPQGIQGKDGKDGIAGKDFNWNLINGTKDFSGFNKYGDDVSFIPDGDFTNVEMSAQAIVGNYNHWILSEKSPIEIKEILDKEFAFSFEFKRASGNGSEVNMCVEFAICTADRIGRVFYKLLYSKNEPISGEWQKKVVTGIANEAFFDSKQSGRTESFEDCTRLWVRIYHAGETPLLIRKCKFELGAAETTWSPSEKDIYGKNGADGKTSYFHIKYSDVANPTTSGQMTETPSTYIGTYVDFVQADSTDPAKYTWSRFEGLQGKDGENGIPGENGENGLTSYLHIAYANSADGKTGFDLSDSINKLYIGQYTDFIKADSTDPTKYSWTKIKGDKGNTGATGVGVKKIVEQYCLSTSAEKPVNAIWGIEVPAWEQGKYIWTRTEVTWTDGSVTYTDALLNESLNDVGANIAGVRTEVTKWTEEYDGKVKEFISKKYYSEADGQKLEDKMTEIETSFAGVDFKFLEEKIDSNTNELKERNKYVRLDVNGVTIGAENSKFKSHFDEDSLTFKYGDVDVARFASDHLQVKNVFVENQLKLQDDWAWRKGKQIGQKCNLNLYLL